MEELLASLKRVDNFSVQSQKQSVFLHLDVAHSTSPEFNDILLLMLIHGALFDPKKVYRIFDFGYACGIRIRIILNLINA